MCGRKFETISQKFWGSNPYVCSSYSGKTGKGAFLPGGPNLFKTFIEVKYTLSREISPGKSFRWGKFLSPCQYFVTFPRRKVFAQI